MDVPAVPLWWGSILQPSAFLVLTTHKFINFTFKTHLCHTHKDLSCEGHLMPNMITGTKLRPKLAQVGDNYHS